MWLLRNSILFIVTIHCFLFASETAEEYFHRAARTYVIAGNAKKAKGIILEGLEKYPDDPQLNTLAQKIKEEEQNQQQQQQNKENQDKQNKDKQDQDKQQDQKNQQDEKDKKEDDKKEDQKNREQQQQEPEAQDKQQQPQPAEEKSEEDMKKDEAARLIELYADDADSLNKPMKKGTGKQKQPERDW